MIPYYTQIDRECHECKADLYIGYEATLHDLDLFCGDDCVVDYIMSKISFKKVYLTDDKTLRDVD